ncbi:aromatic ring-opening dioxygenase [Colletotrichum higginsianum]|nr:aromatic ring-opening dioxygenase [Colletotrichum higginsianum]
MPRLSPLFLLSLSVALTAYMLSPTIQSIFTTVAAKLAGYTSNYADLATIKRPRMPVYFFSHGGKLPPFALPPSSSSPPIGSPAPRPPSSSTRPLRSFNLRLLRLPPPLLLRNLPEHWLPALSARVCTLVASHDIPCDTTERGLDHGVWAGFHASLFRSEDPDAHYRLGRAVSALRDEGVVIIGAGMSVHNLHHMDSGPEPLPYAVSFDDALKEAVEAGVDERQEKMAQVCSRPDAKQAHPWMDHLMPVHVAAGAAGDDLGKQLWTMKEGSFAWAQYRFGPLPES